MEKDAKGKKMIEGGAKGIREKIIVTDHYGECSVFLMRV